MRRHEANGLMPIAKLKAAVAGKEFVPVKAEDIGVEAVDKYTRTDFAGPTGAIFPRLAGAPGFPARTAQSGGAIR